MVYFSVLSLSSCLPGNGPLTDSFRSSNVTIYIVTLARIVRIENEIRCLSSFQCKETEPDSGRRVMVASEAVARRRRA